MEESKQVQDIEPSIEQEQHVVETVAVTELKDKDDSELLHPVEKPDHQEQETTEQELITEEEEATPATEQEPITEEEEATPATK